MVVAARLSATQSKETDSVTLGFPDWRLTFHLCRRRRERKQRKRKRRNYKRDYKGFTISNRPIRPS